MNNIFRNICAKRNIMMLYAMLHVTHVFNITEHVDRSEIFVLGSKTDCQNAILRNSSDDTMQYYERQQREKNNLYRQTDEEDNTMVP